MTRADMLKAALADAVGRLEAVAGGTDELATFIALGESLAWLTIIDEALWNDPGYEQRRDASGCDGQALQGLRLARNCMTHDVLAVQATVDDTVQRGGTVHGGSAIVIRTALRPTHVFVATTLTPTGGHTSAARLADQRASFRDHVAGKEVTDPIGRAARWIVGQL